MPLFRIDARRLALAVPAAAILTCTLAACGSTSSPSPQTAPEPPAIETAPEPDLAGMTASDEAPAADETVAGDADPVVDETFSANGDLEGDGSSKTREALEQAISWATEGIRLFEQGDLAAAHERLHDARIILLDADLPEALQEQGLSFLNCSLPQDLREQDLESLIRDLDLELQAPTSEDAERQHIEREVRRILRRFGAEVPAGSTDIYDEVTSYVDFYRGAYRDFFEAAYDRKHKYWPTIEKVFTARNIPVELGYMALVESGFRPRAYSRANARGIWQFIRSTGRRYGLYSTDDFYDVQKSTVAAAEYLLDLIGIFGSESFLLATAAYNAGEGRIQTCLRQLDDPFGKRNYWEIRGCLARETREYVPRILAAAVIGANPARFGFDLPTEDLKREQFDVVTIPTLTHLATLASRAGTTVAELRTANTDLASTATTTPVRNFPLYVPKGGGEAVVAAVGHGPPAPRPATSSPVRVTSEPASDGRAPEKIVYRVRRGDTLSGIAGRYGLRYTEVASWNGIRRPYRLRVGQELVIYPGGRVPETLTYTVKKGNTLSSIADIFAVRYRDIMAWNGLRSSRLRAGQKLTIKPRHPMRVESYQVRRGDTVAGIARRFGVRVNDVLTANGLGARTLIRPGQRLIVYVS